jgi:hypothetical protein
MADFFLKTFLGCKLRDDPGQIPVAGIMGVRLVVDGGDDLLGVDALKVDATVAARANAAKTGREADLDARLRQARTGTVRPGSLDACASC